MKNVNVTVKELVDGSWMGKCNLGGLVVYKDSKNEVIASVESKLNKEGYSIGNLNEVRF